VNKYGIKIEYRPDEYNGEALARGLASLVSDGEKLFIARAKNGAKDLTDILSSAGIAFDDVPIYEKIRSTERCNIINENDFDFAAFTSSSAVEDFGKVKAVCIGERTAAAARAHGMEVYVSKEATIKSMIEKIRELCL
jgi:uroporphyrinogen III methyltransferase/synthase